LFSIVLIKNNDSERLFLEFFFYQPNSSPYLCGITGPRENAGPPCPPFLTLSKLDAAVLSRRWWCYVTL